MPALLHIGEVYQLAVPCRKHESAFGRVAVANLTLHARARAFTLGKINLGLKSRRIKVNLLGPRTGQAEMEKKTARPN